MLADDDGLYLLHNQTSAAHMLEDERKAPGIGFWLEVQRLVIEPDAPQRRPKQSLCGGRHRRCQPGLEEDRQITIAPDGHRCGCCDDRDCGSQGSAVPRHGTGQQAARGVRPAARMHHARGRPWGLMGAGALSRSVRYAVLPTAARVPTCAGRLAVRSPKLRLTSELVQAASGSGNLLTVGLSRSPHALSPWTPLRGWTEKLAGRRHEPWTEAGRLVSLGS